MRKFKFISIVLCFVMLCSLLVACGGGGSSDVIIFTQASNPNVRYEGTNAETGHTWKYTVNDNPFTRWYNENYDIKYEHNHLEFAEYDTNLDLAVTAGTQGDIFMTSNKDKVAEYYNQGQLKAWDEYIDKDSELWQQTVEGSKTLYTMDGHIYAIATEMPRPVWSGVLARKDLIAAADPTYNPQTATFEQFDAMLHALRAQMPDGKYPLGVAEDPINWNKSTSWELLRGLFNIPVNWQVVKGATAAQNKVVYAPFTSKAFDFLEYARTLYNDNIIPNDFSGLTLIELRTNQITSGGIAMYSDNPWSSLNNAKTLQNTNANYKLRYMAPSKSFYNTNTYFRLNRNVNAAIMLSANCTKPEKVVDLLEIMVSQKVQDKLFFGDEGVHYNKTATGGIEYTDKGTEFFEGQWWSGQELGIQRGDIWHKMQLGMGTGHPNYEGFYPLYDWVSNDYLPADLYLPSSPIHSNKYLLLEPDVSQFYADFIMGKKGATKEARKAAFDEFVSTMNTRGMKDIADYYTTKLQEVGGTITNTYIDQYTTDKSPVPADYDSQLYWTNDNAIA